MVTPRPSLFRTLAIIVSTLLCALFACSCSRSHTPPTITNAEISTKFSHLDGVAGRWDHNNRTIYLSALTNRWTWAHELCHAADSLSLPYDQVLLMAGTLPPSLAHQQALAKQVAASARTIPGPNAHWIALGRICGPQSVGHSEILAHVRTHL